MFTIIMTYTNNLFTPELHTIILNLTMNLPRLFHTIIIKPLKLIHWLHNLFNLLVLNLLFLTEIKYLDILTPV